MVVEQIRDTRLRNGTWTRNRYAAEIGEPPVDGGDLAVLVDRQNLVLWSDMEAMSKATVAAKNPAAAGMLPPGAPPPFGQQGQPGTPGESAASAGDAP